MVLVYVLHRFPMILTFRIEKKDLDAEAHVRFMESLAEEESKQKRIRAKRFGLTDDEA